MTFSLQFSLRFLVNNMKYLKMNFEDKANFQSENISGKVLCCTVRDSEIGLSLIMTNTNKLQLHRFDSAENSKHDQSPKSAHSISCCPPSGTCPAFDSSESNVAADNRAASMLENKTLRDLSLFQNTL